MQITLICCPFKTSFGLYGASLKAAIEKKTGNPMQWVASNCGCGMAVGDSRPFLTHQCDYFEMLHPTDFVPSWLSWLKPQSGAQSGVSKVVSKQTWKRQLRAAARTVFYYFRAKRYAKLSKNANVVHFQQILGAYGAKAVFNWLNQPSNVTRIVTIHELDPDQLEAPEMNKMYNRADAIIVHCEEMRKDLVRLNVQEEKIHRVLYGTEIPASLPDNPREGIVFYGGYFLTHNKGLDTLFKAMSIIQRRMGPNVPTLKIHGYYGPALREQATRLAEEHGVANKIVWLDHLSDEETFQLYQHSQVCVLPYTGSFAGFAASLAAACQLPVVCTRKAGLPDHLGDLGVWVEENNPEQLGERIMELLGDDHRRQEIGARLLKRAKEFLSWDVIADQTLRIYEESTRKKAIASGNTLPYVTKSSVRPSAA
jgi:glycosyltransferase involved in cell wall biosynthesis